MLLQSVVTLIGAVVRDRIGGGKSMGGLLGFGLVWLKMGVGGDRQEFGAIVVTSDSQQYGKL